MEEEKIIGSINLMVIDTVDSRRHYLYDWMSKDEPAQYCCKKVEAYVNQQNPSVWNEDDFAKLFDDFINNPYYDVLTYCGRGGSGEITKQTNCKCVCVSKNDYLDAIKNVINKDLIRLASGRYVTTVYSSIFHIIRASEVKLFYEYTSSIVINGIECNKYLDAGVGHIGYHDKYPGYIDVSDKYKEIIATIPQEDLKMITVGDNPHDGIYKINIIPKKYIDKIILRRKYLHPDLLEVCLEKFYTGEEDVYELDPKNPDPKTLEMMKKYGVI